MKKNYKTSEIIEIYSALESFIKKDIELPAQFVWDLEDNSETLFNIVKRFEKHRADLFQELKNKDAFEPADENGIAKIRQQYRKEFDAANSKLAEYLMTDNEIEIKTAERSSVPEKLSVQDLRAIKFMIQ